MTPQPPYIDDPDFRLYVGDVRETLALLPDETIDCCVTSPPYFGLRDYGTGTWEGGDPDCDHSRRTSTKVDSITTESAPANSNHEREGWKGGVCGRCGATSVDQQIGLESSPDAYVAAIVDVFREVRRVLTPYGTLWLNLGDSYANDTKWGGATGGKHASALHGAAGLGREKRDTGLKSKDLIGIPWRVAFALQADGWCLRSDIVWSKPNPMPESVTDRPTKSHEYVFMLSKTTYSGRTPGPIETRLSSDDARWIALLLDAEGNISVKRGKREGGADLYAAQIAVGSTSRALLEEAQAIVGAGNILERKGRNAPMFYWQLSNKIAQDLLYALHPHLIVKQRQARIAIHLESLLYHRGKQGDSKRRTDSENDVLASLWARNKECNHFGEPDLSDVPLPQYGRWGDSRYYFDQEAVREEFVSTHGSGNGFKRDARLSYGGRGNDEQWIPPVEEPDHVQPTLDDSLPPEAPRGADGRRQTTVRGSSPGEGAHENYANREGKDRWPNPTGRNVRTVWEIVESTEDAAAWLAVVFAEAMRAGDEAVARTVWEIATKPYKGAHFATYPPELVRRCLLAGCPPWVCTSCGRPRERISGRESPQPEVDASSVDRYGTGEAGVHRKVGGQYQKWLDANPLQTLGWSECGCAYGLPPDSLETIETPIGTVGDPDPTLEVGRKGLARPRSEDEGVRLITRHEQRGYAAQLREWSDAARSELLTEFGIAETAWEHYVRVDRSGGRPLPADVLDACLERGWLDPVVLPDRIVGTYRPGVVLDPFMGSGTTALVARDHGRHAVGVELNPEYAALCARRVGQLSLLSSV